MRAVTYDRYGGPEVLLVEEVDKPSVADNRLLIRVEVASVNRSDWESLTGSPAYVRIGGLFKPSTTVLGSDVAGTVEEVGRDVTRFRPGDEVFGDILYSGGAAFAEYVSVPEAAPLALKPPELSFGDAAALPQAGVLAVQGMRAKGGVEAGHKVLINGAGGGGGTFAIQMARSLGAEVVGVDSTIKLDMMRSLGANRVVDYTSEDFTKGPERFDRILDFAGKRSIFAYRRALAPNGVYLIVGGPARRILGAVVAGGLISKMGGKSLGLLMARPNSADLEFLANEVVAGRIKPVIDGTYELEEVPEALRRLGEERSLGKILIRVRSS